MDTSRLPLLYERAGDENSALVFVEESLETIDDWIRFTEDLYSHVLVIMGIKNFKLWLQKDIFDNSAFHEIKVTPDGDVFYFNPLTRQDMDVFGDVEEFFAQLNKKQFLNIPTSGKAARSAMYDLVNMPTNFEKKYLSSSKMDSGDVLCEFLRPLVIEQFNPSEMTEEYFRKHRHAVLRLYGSDRGLIGYAPFEIVRYWRLLEAGQFPSNMATILKALETIHGMLSRGTYGLRDRINEEGLKRLQRLIVQASAMTE